MQLRDYQEQGSDEAAAILLKRKMVYLSWEVRCGKTLTAFATLQKLGANRCLFVTKKKAIPSIQNDAELIGFAQCCSYLLFSNYVFFVCVKPQLPEQEDKVGRIIKLCEHFGIGLLFIGDGKLTVGPRLNHPNDFVLKNRILSLFTN